MKRILAGFLQFLLLLVVFLVVHIVMIALAGFWSRMREMITGGVGADVVVGKERV